MILLIWEEIPDTVKLYLIPEDDALVPLIRSAAGQYVNVFDLEHKEVLALSNEIYGENGDKPWKFEPVTDTVINTNITEVIRAGFYL